MLGKTQRIQDWIGVGLRPTHYPDLEKEAPLRIGWFEAISENYMDTEGRPLEMLLKVRERTPVALHGVSLSIASAHGIDSHYLNRLKKLIERVDPFIVSDHLCWSRSHAHSVHDLMPIPYTNATLDIVTENIQLVQDALKRPLLIENVSTYFKFSDSEFSEIDFLKELTKRSGCKLLLDINNVYVNAKNHHFDAAEFVAQVPSDDIGQIHLAGHTDLKTHLFDTHSKPVASPVWELFHALIKRANQVPILLEWDENLPTFTELQTEALKAAAYMGHYLEN